jgi:mannose-1-phosphate guanylyltransferase/mannose-6-phosphate isomerase
MKVYPVILCGGAGTRLWPASRPSRPKQFADLVSPESMFRQTMARLSTLSDVSAILVVANQRHAPAILDQLGAAAGLATLVLEPVARDSAAAIAAASLLVHRMDPAGVALILPSDHHIPDAAAFRTTADLAIRTAGSEAAIVTFGLRPDTPSTAYGYIRPGAPLGAALRVEAFAEKPDLETARKYVEAGFLWNSGMFVASASVLVSEFERFAPDVLAAAREAIDTAETDGRMVRLGAAFRGAPKISFDYAIMERTTRAAVVPTSMAWSDLGAWDTVLAAADRDGDGNARIGDSVTIDVRNCYLYASHGRLVAALGVENLAVVVEDDAVLVCDLGRTQEVKALVERLTRDGRKEVDFPPPSPTRAVDPAGIDLSVWMSAGALALWWTLGFDHESGAFRESLALDGRPVIGDWRCDVQASQIAAYAAAGSSGWQGPWRQTVDQGVAQLNRSFRRAEGLYAPVARQIGSHPPAPTLDDQALVLLALARASGALLNRPDLEAEALELLDRVGAWRAAGDARARSAHLGLLEAAMAWTDIGTDPAWRDLAASEVALRLGEDDPWEGSSPTQTASEQLPPSAGRPAPSPTAAFQWAWLLERWVGLSGDALASSAARRLFIAGQTCLDPGRDAIVEAVRPGTDLARAEAPLCAQTARLRAAAILGERDHARRALRCVAGYLAGAPTGLWRETLTADGGFLDQSVSARLLWDLTTAFAEAKAVGAGSQKK